MGKNKKKQDKGVSSTSPVVQTAPVATGTALETACTAESDLAARVQTGANPEQPPSPVPVAPSASIGTPRPVTSRARRWLPDLLKGVAALLVIGVAAAIWYKPPLTLTDFPYLSYQFQGQTFTDAQLFRPLAMPTRFYIRLPKKLADRYEWFAVDRRREVAALATAPSHRFLGRDAIKRSDPLGLDLEFRKLDHSEWQVYFLPDSVVFSNSVLAVRMDTERAPNAAR